MRVSLIQCITPSTLTSSRYCGIDAPSSIVKCVTCDKWFCNSRGTSSSSHIINHLVRSRHKVVSLHENSELGETTLECYNCGNQNVFVLGFISAKAESVIVILCRYPCANTPVNKDMNWDSSKWDPLISDRSFSNWLVSVPSTEEVARARKVTPAQMTKLEEVWRNNPKATIEDLDKPDLEQSIPHVVLRYEDGYEYQRCFGPLVMYEAEYDRKQKEAQTQTNVSVTWDLGLSRRHLVSFFLQDVDTTGTRVMIGDVMSIYYQPDGGMGAITAPNSPVAWKANGYVIKIPDSSSEEITLELQLGADPPTHFTSGFTIQFMWSGITYERIQKSLKDFATEETSVSGYLYHKLLGHEVKNIVFNTQPPTEFSVPGIAELNPSQSAAVASVLRHPLSLIQGPPGTGKTVVSTTIVYHILKMTSEAVLVCAPSNVAADQLADRLQRTGLKVVRLVAKSRETVLGDAGIKGMTLGDIIMNDEDTPQDLRKLQQLKDDVGELSQSDRNRYFKLLRDAERRILQQADVVCCTCAAAGDLRLRRVRFRTVLIDESTQATEPECLIPIVHGCKQLVLVGDHQQLGPVVGCKAAANAGLSKSLFERLIVLGHTPIRLTVQYRMHPCLSEFPSNMFYDGSLQNGITQQERMRPDVNFPWPVPETPMMFWSVLGKEEISSSGTSYLNRAEASNCERVVTRLFKAGVDPDQIGIITPYEGQRTYLNQHMITNGTMDRELYRQVEVESVDAFQGREKDYIIVSCVRSNEYQGIGFLSDPRRLNVALTRAKYGLILLGNPRVLSKNLLWLHLLTHFREQGCLVEGLLSRLQPSTVQLSKPRQLTRRFIQNEASPQQAPPQNGAGYNNGNGMPMPQMPPSQYLNGGMPVGQVQGNRFGPVGGFAPNGRLGQLGPSLQQQYGNAGNARPGPPGQRYFNDMLPHDETSSEKESGLDSDFLHETESDSGMESSSDLESQLGDPLDVGGMPVALSRVAAVTAKLPATTAAPGEGSGIGGLSHTLHKHADEIIDDGEETVLEYEADDDFDDDEDDVISNIRSLGPAAGPIGSGIPQTVSPAAAEAAARAAASIFQSNAQRAAMLNSKRKFKATASTASAAAAQAVEEQRHIGSSFGDRLNQLISKTDALAVGGSASGPVGSGLGNGLGPISNGAKNGSGLRGRQGVLDEDDDTDDELESIVSFSSQAHLY